MTSPFIPPLHTPQSSPLPPQPPVIPSPVGGGTLPPWGQTPQHPGSYPIYPHTPYTSSPYIPNLPSITPASGGYLPSVPDPHYPPHLHHPQQPPQTHRPGFSMDYTGYPQLGNTPFAGPSATLHPPTPYGLGSAPLHGGGVSWAPQRQPYPPFGGHPMSAGPYPPGAYHDPRPPASWGALPHLTPNHPMNPDLWNVHTPGAGWGPQSFPQPPPPPQMNLPQHLQLGRASAHVGDRVDPFMAGNNYGPVLDPLLIRVVQAEIRLNPLIEPLPENGGDRPHLKWNMLFQSNTCQRSTDPAHVSWSNGRDEPATFPRVTNLNIISETFPWILKIRASNPDTGVTCGELIDSLSDEFYKLTSAADYEALPQQKKHVVGEAYRFNRSRAHGVPGGRLNQGMRRLDYFCRDTIFGGILNDTRLVKRILGADLPCTFVLKCVRRYALTAEEIREHDARERAAAEASRRRTSVHTVDSTTGSDEDD